MRVVWERDTWFWEEMGILLWDGVKWGYWGYIGQARPLPSWLQWLPEFRLRYPDKVAHAVAAFGLAWLFSCWLQPYHAAGLAFLAMVGYEFLPLLWGKTAYVSVKDLIANTVGVAVAVAVRA